jgi:hypothetical protein
MAIVDYAYYSVTYGGEPIAESEFTRADVKAERVIRQITRGRAAEENFATLPAFAQTAVKEAICAQIEYYALNGLDLAVNGDTSGGWSVGKVRVDKGTQGAANAAGSTLVCAAVYSALEQTGLLNPSVPTLGEPPRVPWPWGVV